MDAHYNPGWCASVKSAPNEKHVFTPAGHHTILQVGVPSQLALVISCASADSPCDAERPTLSALILHRCLHGSAHNASQTCYLQLSASETCRAAGFTAGYIADSAARPAFMCPPCLDAA